MTKFLMVLLVFVVSAISVEESIQDLMTRVKTERSEFARKNNIANMNEVSYDASLEKLVDVKKFLCDSEVKTHSNYVTYAGDAEHKIYEVATITKVARVKISECHYGAFSLYISDKPKGENIKGEPGSACSGSKTEDGICRVSSNGKLELNLIFLLVSVVLIL